LKLFLTLTPFFRGTELILFHLYRVTIFVNASMMLRLYVHFEFYFEFVLLILLKKIFIQFKIHDDNILCIDMI